MPEYKYICEKCNETVSFWKHIKKYNPEQKVKCKKCGGKMARVIERSSFKICGRFTSGNGYS